MHAISIFGFIYHYFPLANLRNYIFIHVLLLSTLTERGGTHYPLFSFTGNKKKSPLHFILVTQVINHSELSTPAAFS